MFRMHDCFQNYVKESLASFFDNIRQASDELTVQDKKNLFEAVLFHLLRISRTTFFEDSGKARTIGIDVFRNMVNEKLISLGDSNPFDREFIDDTLIKAFWLFEITTEEQLERLFHRSGVKAFISEQPLLLTDSYVCDPSLPPEKGGFKFVQKRTQRETNRSVALKYPKDKWNEVIIKSIEAECLVQLKLSPYPNIPTVLSWGAPEQWASSLDKAIPVRERYIVEEWIDGKNWRESIKFREKTLKTIDAKEKEEFLTREFEKNFDVLKQVARTANHAHESKVVHCDLKPENVMLSNFHFEMPKEGPPDWFFDGAYVVDWGVATEFGGISSGCYTPVYAPKERENILATFDVYSLGVILAKDVIGEKREPILTEFYVYSDLRFHYDLVNIVRKATQSVSNDRYKNAGQFLEDLETWEKRRYPILKRLCDLFAETSSFQTDVSQAFKRAEDSCTLKKESLKNDDPLAFSMTSLTALSIEKDARIVLVNLFLEGDDFSSAKKHLRILEAIEETEMYKALNNFIGERTKKEVDCKTKTLSCKVQTPLRQEIDALRKKIQKSSRRKFLLVASKALVFFLACSLAAFWGVTKRVDHLVTVGKQDYIAQMEKRDAQIDGLLAKAFAKERDVEYFIVDPDAYDQYLAPKDGGATVGGRRKETILSRSASEELLEQLEDDKLITHTSLDERRGERHEIISFNPSVDYHALTVRNEEDRAGDLQAYLRDFDKREKEKSADKEEAQIVFLNLAECVEEWNDMTEDEQQEFLRGFKARLKGLGRENKYLENKRFIDVFQNCLESFTNE